MKGTCSKYHVKQHLTLVFSGANDGLGYPFLFLAIYLMQMSVGPAIGKWAYYVMAYNVLLSILIGFVAGYVARKLLKYSEQKYDVFFEYLYFKVVLIKTNM